jgi:predicted dienelactone hydrolase
VVLLSHGSGSKAGRLGWIASNANLIPGPTYHAIPGAHHFSFPSECSSLGFVIIGPAGDDNICSDRAQVHARILGQLLPFQHTAFGLPQG